MNVRELIDVLGAGDLDAEVYIAGDGPHGPRPLAYLDEWFHRDRSRLTLCPVEIEEGGGVPPIFVSDSAFRVPRSALPLVRTGQGNFVKDYPPSPKATAGQKRRSP